jgi:hypothetical protein
MRTSTENNKFDIAIIPHTYAAAVTSPYFNLVEYRNATFVVTVAGTIPVNDAFQATCYEAEDGAGTGAQLMVANLPVIGFGNVAADAMPGITRGTIEMLAVGIGETVTITVNGVDYVFTAAAVEDIEAREFDQHVDDDGTAASLVACVNDATYGVPGVTAEIIAPATDVVTLYPTEPGQVTFDVAVSDEAETIPVPLEMIGIIEVQDSSLDEGFSHIAVEFHAAVAAGTPEVSAVLIREMARQMPVKQAVHDSESV